MELVRVAVVGYGNLGKACVRVIGQDARLTLAGIVRRPEHAAERPAGIPAQLTIVSHVGELARVDAALICVPTEQAGGIARDVLQLGVPIVECATLHGEAFAKHKEEIGKTAVRQKVSAVVGAGWDPGLLSIFRAAFALLTPQGHTAITHRPGVSLHHTLMAGRVPGVRGSLATEARTPAGRVQRYVYVELEAAADMPAVEEAIRNDPLFAGEETQVFPVENLAQLEEEGHGVVLERHGAAGAAAHQSLLLEARFSELALAAQVMVAAAKALPLCPRGASSLLDLPFGALWGRERAAAELAWL